MPHAETKMPSAELAAAFLCEVIFKNVVICDHGRRDVSDQVIEVDVEQVRVVARINVLVECPFPDIFFGFAELGVEVLAYTDDFMA